MLHQDERQGRCPGPRVGRFPIWSWIALLLPWVACGPAAAGDGARPPIAALRRLTGKELAEAQQARDKADRLRHDYEVAAKGGPADKTDEVAEAVFKAAEAAYREAADKHPGTDIAAYCLVRLSGLYQYRKDYAGAATVLQDVAERYAGTEQAAEAFFSMGLMQLQARHDPAAAAPWFEKVAPPPTGDEHGVVSERDYSRADVRHLSAQQQLAKCEIRLGKPADAARRTEALSKRYPQYHRSIASALRSQVKSAMSDHTLTAIKPILAKWLEENP